MTKKKLITFKDYINALKRLQKVAKELEDIVKEMGGKLSRMDTSDSDQGKIYIIYGRPQNIDYEFNENGEYEIWQYRNKKFVFINRFGYFECYQC